MRRCATVFGGLLLALATAPGCAPRPAPSTVPEPVEDAARGVPDAEEAPPPQPLPVVALAPLWETVARPEEGFAGLAVWPGAGQRPWLLAAAAASHRLVLFDAGSGELLREVGALGERAGSFREPVAVAVGGGLAFVAERGNARVQVLRLPGLATVGFLGEGELARPAAVAVEPSAEGWTVWVGEEEVDGVEVAGGAEVASGAVVPGGSRAVVHRFEVAADGSPLSWRRIELVLDGSRGGRLVGLVLGPIVGEQELDARPMLVAVASGGGEVVGSASPAALSGRPLDVVAGVVAGAAALPCGAGGGWIVALEHGGLLAFAAAPPAAVSSLTVDGVAAAVALAVTGQPLGEAAPGTLYALTADSRVIALAGGELAALAPAVCR